MPSTAEAVREYFEPLADLNIGTARVFLGIGHRDGTEAVAARDFLPDFEISHYCGYRRDDRERTTQLLSELRVAADLLAAEAD